MKSVFDGWEKKIEGRARDGIGGYCALGWLNQRYWSADAQDPTADLNRIGKWISANIDGCPFVIERHEWEAVVWANNECALDIEGFKMADLLSQGYVPDDAPVEEPVTVNAG